MYLEGVLSKIRKKSKRDEKLFGNEVNLRIDMNNGYWNKLIIDLLRTEENKELFASRIDMEKEEEHLKNIEQRITKRKKKRKS